MARSDRRSQTISDAQLDNLEAAVAHAERVGVPLNCHLTIHWNRNSARSWSDTAQRYQGPFLAALSKWLRRRGLDLHCVWVAEVGGYGSLHTHTLIHLPGAPRRLKADLVDWIAHRTGQPADRALRGAKAHTIGRAEPEGTYKSPIWQLDRVYGGPDGSEKAVAYITKAKQRRHRHQIIGKRVGTTNNLGPQARADWKAEKAAEASQGLIHGDLARVA